MIEATTIHQEIHVFINRSRLVCFSPTGSTRKLGEAVAGGAGFPCSVTDITLPEKRKAIESFALEELCILAVPVYYGRVAKTAVDYMTEFQGNGAPVALLVNYGNRHFDDALLELYDLAVETGFVPVGAAAFVSEHSFSTRDYPMAIGRPEESDLSLATEFGNRVAQKVLNKLEKLENIPGNLPYKPYPDLHRAPASLDNCTLCGTCAGICPVDAIRIHNGILSTDEQKCIICQACVKKCPEQARIDCGPGAIESRERLKPLVAERREVEFFL